MYLENSKINYVCLKQLPESILLFLNDFECTGLLKKKSRQTSSLIPQTNFIVLGIRANFTTSKTLTNLIIFTH